jgi:hypothetical protein
LSEEDEMILARRKLAGLKVPAAYYDQIIALAREEQQATPPKAWTSGWAATALVFCYIGAAWATWQLLDGFAFRHAQERAEALGAPVIHVNFGFGLLLAFFTLPFASVAVGPFWQTLTGPLARRHQFVPASNLLKDKPGWLTRSAVTHAARSSTRVEDFVTAVYRWQSGWIAGPCLALVIAGIAITALETRSYFVAGPAGIEHGRMVPPFSIRTYSWTEATSVELGCNSTDDEELLIYGVIFPNGNRFDIGEAKQVIGPRIPSLEAIDAELPASIPRKRWEWLGRDSMAELSVSAWSETVNDGQARLTHLLRVN